MKHSSGLNGLACVVALAAAMVMGSASPGHADTTKTVPADINQVPTSIVQLISGGYWSQGEQEGFFRAIVAAAGTEHVNHSMYLQWVQIDLQSGNSTIKASTGVDELNLDHTQGHLLEVKREDSELGSLRLSIVVSRARSDDKLTYVLTADGAAGKYKITQSK